jgi:SAM-dependent methyltransferase
MSYHLYYHAHHSLHDEDLAFWLDLAAQQPGPILELGCGTGRVLIPLARSGHAVVGLDRDPGMLALLMARMPAELHQTVMLFRADFTRFHLARSFGLILMPCNTYSTLSKPDRQSVLACVRAHLSAEGMFAISLPNPDWLRSIPSRSDAELEEVFPHPLDGEPVQVSSAWKRTRSRSRPEFILEWYYDHLNPDGSVERLSVQLIHDLTPAAYYLEEIHAAGFERVQSYGGFDRSAFTSDSSEWIILAS